MCMVTVKTFASPLDLEKYLKEKLENNMQGLKDIILTHSHPSGGNYALFGMYTLVHD